MYDPQVPQRVCRQCGQKFYPKGVWQVYCNDCQGEWGGDREPRTPTKPLVSAGNSIPNGREFDQFVSVCVQYG